ncbi:S1 family peptidase [Streptomyces phaeoluteigriseus]|uniref:S1 family peptidase n=1 Tax=Streptomyces phaeoluteigriseus TaxID=114686 RepID=A0ABY4ZAF3_9ACTN|nr:S1 family peptidase [Streptomyces phaeoluteigriseus]USQ85862.1 S1 family peptidase [Streptomyces phaeoluteigriseus]
MVTPASEPPPDGFAQSGEEVAITDPGYLRALTELDLDAFPSDLLEARAAMEEFLCGQADQRSAVRSAADVTDTTNIQGVGIGRSASSGQQTLNVYLAQPRETEDVESLLVERLRVGAAASPRVAVVPVITGMIEPRAYTFHRRPAPGGISVHRTPTSRPTSGTLGCLVTGRSDPRDKRTLLLGCNHVLANNNNAALGDVIIQPGGRDGGSSPQDLIAVLERFVELKFDGSINSVDCATAWAAPANVSPDILMTGVLGPVEVPISSTTAAVTVDSLVFKSGRTTEITAGIVREVGASHWVEYSTGNAFFSGGIGIEGTIGHFSEEGDSGSIVWTLGLLRNPVGMIYGGTENFSRSFAHPIDIVTQALDVFIINTL